MAPLYSELSETLIGSEIVKLGNMIRNRKAAGETIYNFTIGDFDPSVFPIPQALENEILAAYKHHLTSYPLADGELDLRQSVSSFLKHYEGLEYGTSEIQIASGGRPLIYAIFRALVNPGDKVIYATPSWNNNHYAHFTKAEHVVVEATLENAFMPTAGQIAPHLKGAALLCLCTPQNPTGTTLPKIELEKICRLVLEENATRGEGEKKLYILFDQMYWTLCYGETKHYNPVGLVPEIKPYTIFVDGISKAFAATGVRVGWSMGSESLISKLRAILSHVGAWAPMPEQKATAKYLKNHDAIEKYLQEFKEKIEFRLNAIYEGIMKLKTMGHRVDAVAPQAAIYLTIQFDLVGKVKPNGASLAKQEDVTEYLLESAGLAIVPFSAFGASKDSSWYRLSVGTCKEEDIAPMFEKLSAALNALV